METLKVTPLEINIKLGTSGVMNSIRIKNLLEVLEDNIVISRVENDWENATLDSIKTLLDAELLTQVETLKAQLKGTEPALDYSKAYKLSTLTITTSKGYTFDVNEKGMLNLSATIIAYNNMPEPKQTTSMWVMADNSQVEVTIEDIIEAHMLGIQAIGEVTLSETVTTIKPLLEA